MVVNVHWNLSWSLSVSDLATQRKPGWARVQNSWLCWLKHFFGGTHIYHGDEDYQCNLCQNYDIIRMRFTIKCYRLFLSSRGCKRQLFVQVYGAKIDKFLHNLYHTCFSYCCQPPSRCSGESKDSSNQTSRWAPLHLTLEEQVRKSSTDANSNIFCF